jgi:hypothetical protein
MPYQRENILVFKPFFISVFNTFSSLLWKISGHDEQKLEELYKDLHLGRDSHFHNGINMSIWGTDYAWSKLR